VPVSKTPIIEVRDLEVILKNQKILSNVNIDIYAGEYVAIIGPNGGGKTTFIRTILGLEKKSKGSIKLFSKDLENFKEFENIGYVPQRIAQNDKNFPATALDIVKMGFIKKGSLFDFLDKNELKKVKDIMQKMGVWELKDKLIGDLSGGQKQRVMIARALVSNPKVLILDEPNAGVDVKNQKNFYKLLKTLNQEGITIIFITHDVGVIVDDISKLITINQSAKVFDNIKEMISCDDISNLYGVDAHLLSNHSKSVHVRI